MGNLHGLEPEQLARIGIFYLEEAVLDILHEARHSEEWLEPKEISERLDIARSPCYHLHATVHGILGRLMDEGRAEHDSKARKRWQLTEEEFENRCDDL